MFIIGVIFTLSLPPGDLSALSSGKPCSPAEVIFARGSGENLNDKEFVRLRSVLDDGVSKATGVRPNYYELGTEFYGGNKYPAVSISPWENKLNTVLPWLKIKNAQYTDSVKAGEAELRTYLAQRVANCPTSRIVLGGYSQGAQVVGNTLPSLPPTVRSKIAFVSLFADPKLHLPEGDDVWNGCLGRNMSPWRRGNPLCYVRNGILEARKPYIPSDMIGRVGSWCDKKDLVCTNSGINLLSGNTHSQYVTKGYVDQAAREIASKFKKSSFVPAAATLDNKPAITYADRQRATSSGTVWEALFGRLKALVAGGDGAAAKVDLAAAETDNPNVTVLPTIDEFYAKPGDEITFDVLMSYNEDSELFTKYDWDFNSDGVVDKTTNEFRATHTYAEPYEGTASVRAYIATGESNAAQFTMHVSQDGGEQLLPGDVTGLAATQTQTSDTAKTVVLNWNAAANAEVYNIYIDGEAAGYVESGTTSITLTDVPNDVEHVFGVSAGNQLASGTMATVTAPVLTTPPACPVGQTGTPPRCTTPPPPAPPKPLSPACRALVKLKPYLHPTVYHILWQTLRCG